MLGPGSTSGAALPKLVTVGRRPLSTSHPLPLPSPISPSSSIPSNHSGRLVHAPPTSLLPRYLPFHWIATCTAFRDTGVFLPSPPSPRQRPSTTSAVTGTHPHPPQVPSRWKGLCIRPQITIFESFSRPKRNHFGYCEDLTVRTTVRTARTSCRQRISSAQLVVNNSKEP